MKINKSSYQKLIDQNIDWLKTNTTDTLERQHIILILEQSVNMYYPPPATSKSECPDCGKMVLNYLLDTGCHRMTGCTNLENEK